MSSSADLEPPVSIALSLSVPETNNWKLVFDTNIVIVSVFGLFVLACLPRAVARICSVEWNIGHTLRHTRLRHHRNRAALTVTTSVSSSSDRNSDRSHSYQSHIIRRRPNTTHSRFPLHQSALSSILHPVAWHLRPRISPGFCCGQALILALYAGVLTFASLHDSNIFADPVRTGYIATSQVPFVFALAMKNNFAGWLVGAGYEKVNYIHRFAGRAVFILSNIHALGYIYEWSLGGRFTANAKIPSISWGLLALACADVLVLTSTDYLRRKAYRLFANAHVVGFAILLPAITLHKSSTTPYMLVSVFIYAVDRLLRLFKSRLSTAYIRPLPELSTTRVEIPGINTGWCAGQHVRLRVLASGMSWWRWSEVHPFTITSVSHSDEGLVLLVKKNGSWTGALYEIAKASGYGEKAKIAGRSVRVMVEGPYGGPGHTIYSSFSGALLLCGGSGISFGLAALQELVQKDLEDTSRVKAIELIWCVQDPASLIPLAPQFTSIIQQSASIPINISVFYTRAKSTGTLRITKDYLVPGLSLTPGRPKIDKVLDSVISRAMGLGLGAKGEEALCGVIVGVCGPVGLSDDASRIIARVDRVKRKSVGGIELHEEIFGW